MAAKAEQAPQAGIDLDALKGFLSDALDAKIGPLTARLDAFEGRLAEVREQTPRFVPMERPEQPRRPGDVLRSIRKGEERGGTFEQIPQGINGMPLDRGEARALYDLYRPAHEQGDTVVIDRASVRAGWPEGKTWGDVLAKHHSDGVGTVLKRNYLDDRGEWSYQVRVPVITPAWGMTFAEHELVPA